MIFPINTIAKRLFFSFGILVLNIIIVTLVALFFLQRTRTIGNLTQRLDNQRVRIIELIKTDLDFLRFETVNIEYFQTGQSQLLQRRDSLFKIIYSENNRLYAEMNDEKFLEDFPFADLDKALKKYSSTFRVVTEKINERGFKDFGVEGLMRVCAHELEDKASHIALVNLLTLRRHEKDFLLRREVRYITLFDSLANKLNPRLNKAKHFQSASLLAEYQYQFKNLTRLSYEIGNTPSSGLLGELNNQTRAISNKLTVLTNFANARKEEVITRSGWLFLCISTILILLSLALTFFTSTRFARPIKRLSQSMGKFIVNEGLNEKELEGGDDSDEISTLSRSFIKLSRKLKRQFNEILQQNKELKKLNDELDRFIYSAAHDLKSPLASLDGLIHLAEIEIASPRHAHYFQRMNDSVHKMNGFIRDITDYAKNKRQELKTERINLELLVNDILESLRFLPDAERIQVLVNMHHEEFFTDRTRLEIILKNLLSNSFRYTDFVKHDPFIKIESRMIGDQLRIMVTDNGIGIDKQHLHKIFDMFYRAVEHSKGTGIGLFLVKESVKMLRGRISVKSSLGEWTVFTLTIPNLRHGAIHIPETEAVELELTG